MFQNYEFPNNMKAADRMPSKGTKQFNVLDTENP
jgi:hypothetical protein